MTEQEAMARALTLARKGWGRVAPNPMVGAVLLKGGEVVAQGYHAEFGRDHAERAALAACQDPRGATCVVTLEPCAQHGKTPPCVDALIAAHVGRVVYAIADPHPVGRGGAQRLREAGIDVEGGVLAEAAAALNAAFLWSVCRAERPFVALKVATSLDGFIADSGGRSQWISGEEGRQFVHWLRAGYDAIGIGRATAERDDPRLTVRGSVTPRVTPTRIVFARSGRLPERLRLVRTARETPTVLLTEPAARDGAEAALAKTGVKVVAAEGLAQGLRALRDAGVGSILVEGGGTIAGALLAAGLVDRVYWLQAPIWLGQGTPAFPAQKAWPLGAAPRWVVTERRALGQDTLLVVDRELCLRGL